MDNKEIIRRYQQLKSDRHVAEEVWDLLEKFVYPLGGGKYFQMLANEGEVNWRRRNIYDDTAILGADTLAASIHGSLTSPATKWFDLNFRDPVLNADTDAKAWLDECGVIVWDTIQQSNFNLEVSEGYLDLTSFGNTMLTQEPIDDITWEGVTFNSVPLRENYFEEDEKGGVLNFYRRLQWKPSQFKAKFGDDVPDVIKSQYDKAVASKIELVYCVYRDEENKDTDTSKLLSKEKRPYKYKYVLVNGAEECGKGGGYYEMPAYAIRWRRTSGSQWGYGPGHVALSTVLTLNEMIKLVLESAEKVIDPASLIQARGLLSDLDLSPGGQTVVKDADKSVKAYESRARFDVSAVQINDLRDMIRRLYHVDQLELKESPAMSATEVMVRYELMNRLLGPTMGRLQNDMLDPVVTNTFKMLHRAKQFPDMPQSVAAAGGVVNVEYVGPLSRAQKTDEVASVERWLGNIGNLAEIFPDIRHVPDPKAIAVYMADSLNVPAKLMKSEAQINTAVAEERKMKQAAVEGAQAEQQAKIEATQNG